MPLLSPNEVAHVVTWAGWTGADRRIATAVAAGESGWDPEAMARTNTATSKAFGQRAVGLFMISNYWHPEKMNLMGNWRDPYDNAKVARTIFVAAGGWSPWEAFTNKSYERHLADADIGLKAPVRAPRAPGARSVVS